MFLLFVRYLHGRSHAPINASRLSMSCWFRVAGPIHETHCKLRSSAAVGTCDTSTPYSSPKGDWRFPYDVEEDSRSRFAEPREGEEMLIPQRRSFGACSGFQIDTCPIGTRRRSYCHTVTEYCRFNHLSCHANIVQRVKTCYKIKIHSRD